MGATGDGGHFDTLADLLGDDFTVITSDRHENGRSPAPAGWTTTSAEEQADDAAALVDSLAVGPLAVFGTSSGGNFALWMLTRHPAMVRGAVLHDPGVYAVLDDFDVVRAPLQGVVRQSMAEGGPRLAVERFWQYICGDDAWIQLSPALRERICASASTLFGVELGTYERSMPDDQALVAIAVPVLLVVRIRQPRLLRRGRRATQQATRRRCREHAGQARGLPRPPQGTRRDDTAVPARSQSVVNGRATSRCIGVSHALSHDVCQFESRMGLLGPRGRAETAWLSGTATTGTHGNGGRSPTGSPIVSTRLYGPSPALSLLAGRLVRGCPMAKQRASTSGRTVERP